VTLGRERDLASRSDLPPGPSGFLLALYTDYSGGRGYPRRIASPRCLSNALYLILFLSVRGRSSLASISARIPRSPQLLRGRHWRSGGPRPTCPWHTRSGRAPASLSEPPQLASMRGGAEEPVRQRRWAWKRNPPDHQPGWWTVPLPAPGRGSHGKKQVAFFTAVPLESLAFCENRCFPRGICSILRESLLFHRNL